MAARITGLFVTVLTVYIALSQAEIPKLEVEASASSSIPEIIRRNELVNTGVYFYELDELQRNASVADINHLVQWVKYRAHFYNDLIRLGYNDENILAKSAGPEVDQELCLDQLRELNERLRVHAKLKSRSTDVNLHRLLDTFGREPTGRLAGQVTWPGDYENCLGIKIITLDNRNLSTRYCWAKLQYDDYPGSKEDVVRVGVCLPKACDSLNHKDKYQLVHSLMSHQIGAMDRDGLKLYDLFCLPDEDSPARAWSPATVVFVSILSLWLLAMVYATFQCELFASESQIYRSLSIAENSRSLFRLRLVKDRICDLSVVDGMKVLAAANIVASHSILGPNSSYTNLWNLGHMLSPIYLVTYMMPTFIVSMFMSISGLLTSYHILKYDEVHEILSKPFIWVYLFLQRYLRSVMILSVGVAFHKYLLKHLMSGPFWDYGTNADSSMWICEHEPWWRTLLLLGNTARADYACMPSSWYISIDFQWFLVTPIFLYALTRYRRVGLAIVLGTMAFAYSRAINCIYESGMNIDLSPVRRFEPHGFQIAAAHMMDNYMSPLQRIPAFLLGVLVGYSMYNHEKRVSASRTQNGGEKYQQRLELPLKIESYGEAFCWWLLLMYHLSPYIGRMFPADQRETAKWLSITNPMCHVLSGILSTLYTYLAAFGHGNRWVNLVLAHPFWQPFARVGLSLLVSHFAMIRLVSGLAIQMEQVNSLFLVRVFMINVVGSYLLAMLVYVLLEEPLKRLASVILDSMMLKKPLKKSG